MFDVQDFLWKLSFLLIPGIFAITLHEVAHGWAAKRLGDTTAYMLGRLSVNPLKDGRKGGFNVSVKLPDGRLLYNLPHLERPAAAPASTAPAATSDRRAPTSSTRSRSTRARR